LRFRGAGGLSVAQDAVAEVVPGHRLIGGDLRIGLAGIELRDAVDFDRIPTGAVPVTEVRFPAIEDLDGADARFVHCAASEVRSSMLGSIDGASSRSNRLGTFRFASASRQ